MSDYNASDLRQIRSAKKAARQTADERRLVVLSIASSPAGRSWFHDLFVKCHVFGTSFSQSALSMAFAEGERNVGLQLLNELVASAPDQYIAMMREANDKEQANDRRDAGRGDAAGDRAGNGRDDSGPEPNLDPNFDDNGQWIGEGPDPRSDYNPSDRD